MLSGAVKFTMFSPSSVLSREILLPWEVFGWYLQHQMRMS